ncbi:MAG: hypothetical protein H7A36_02190 [Chlamydiales bacterium]|nr:hypothetical protein [Chlamydiales bacterium]
MKRFFLSLLLLTLVACGGRDKKAFVTSHTYERDTRISYPFVSGDLFRHISDHIVDETHIPFSPKSVKGGEVVFVKAKYLDKFFKHMHPHIRERYVLVTGNGDEEVPGAFAKYLDDKKILMWFGMNATLSHPKLMPIPIGMNGNSGANCVKEKHALKLLASPLEKERLLYMNVAVPNHCERAQALRHFQDTSFCFCDTRRPVEEFLEEVMRSKYTLCPRGNGIDTHRVWEALFLGSIPVLKSNALDPLYEGLPVLIVKEWEEVTKELLESKYEEILAGKHKMEKLYADYWLKLIDIYSCGGHYDAAALQAISSLIIVKSVENFTNSCQMAKPK